MSYLFWLAVLLSPYWLGPIVVWATQRWSTRPVFEPFDPSRHGVPDDVATAFRATRDALAGTGFHSVADLFYATGAKRVSMRVALLESSGAAELALVVAAYSAARPARLVACYVELPTKLADGRTVTVNNNPRLGAFEPRPPRTVVRLPDVRDPVRLCRIRRALLEHRYAGVAQIPFEHQGDAARFLAAATVRELEEQVEAGTWWRDDRAQVFRPTFAGAWAMTWWLLPPFSILRERRVRRAAARILAELGEQGADARPVAVPRTRVSIMWLVAFAAVIIVLVRAGASALRRSRVADDAIVPGDFQGAVRALERLADAMATPLVGMDSLGDSVVTEGFAVELPAARAERLVADAQPRFGARGFYLFRSEQHFGVGHRRDRVALYPRADPYELVRLMGTNGWNYGIGPDSIVAWLALLGHDEPFVLTGIGFDWIEGRFVAEPRDADALARRFYAFCPDIVDQGTGTVAALASELRRSRTLYCWWD